MKLLINWIKKKLGYHVCEEFTQWEKKRVEHSRPTDVVKDGALAAIRQKTISRTVKWQERRCTICGKIQQQRLKY